MILRKPYAFFIKHFKLMHVLLAAFMCYSLYKTKELLDFFNEYSAILINTKGQDLVTPLLPGLFQFVPFLIIIVSIIILVVMIVKKKPCLFYVILIACYIYCAVLLQISRFTLISLSTSTVDSRTILLLRDLIMISFIIQIFELIIVFVRATGFDVKKFDFDADLKKINITEEDREEVEVELNFDGNKLIRNIRRQIRFLRYTYKENKKIANIVISVFGVIIIFTIISASIKKNPIINQNEIFSGNNFTLSITDSYLTNTDYKGKTITEDYYLILRLNIKNNSNKSKVLDIATTKILIDDYVYTPTTQYKDSFSDFGTVYLGEEIKEETKKILVYQIPKELINKKIIFSYVDKNNMDEEGNFKSVRININYKDVIGVDSYEEVKLNEELIFEDSIMSTVKIKINAFDIQSKYKLSYNYCVKTRCYDSYEYLVPSVNSNYDKVLLKLSGTFETEEQLPDIYDLYDFIEKFGKLSYVIDGQEKIQNIEFKEVKSKKMNQQNIYYIEVLDEVKQAEKISFFFTIRNKNYKYIIK